ncbi:ATP-binding protein [Streptomyces sp. NPDC007907]|uniref:ATP-binding protein n=1 Tax=Streptomyces sp. NPDC007907 TaxID=3364789 RepID=UPI0036EF6E76
MAIAVGDPSCRAIKGILIAGTETEPETSGDAGATAFLHGPSRLFATVTTPDTSSARSALGKTHIAQALVHLAVRQGARVRFAKTSRILADLAGGHADRTWEKRIRELVRPDVLILDDFAMRQLTTAQADDLYELVSERQGRSLIITSNRAPSDWTALTRPQSNARPFQSRGWGIT